MKYFIIMISVFISGLLGLAAPNSAEAQSKAGRIAFGFDAGGNKYYGNYTDSRFAFQGDAFIRWNVLDWFSLHAAYNGGVLGWKTTAQMIANENAMFPNSSGSSGGAIGSINHTRVGGWDLMASANVFPSETFVPYFIAGLEALNFEPDDAAPVPLKGNAISAYSKNVLGGALGVGFEMYISPKIVFNGKGLLHLTGTDWIDDYSNPNDFRQDAFLTMGLGFSYYIFATEEPAPVLAEAPRIITRDIVHNNYHIDTVFMSRVDTVYVKDLAETMYLNPPVNTVFYFPGTLFVVNTDEFNTTAPNNIRNLYNIRTLVDQCPSLKVEVQGYASEEGTAEHNQALSERRANRIRDWLIGEGVSPNKITRTVGYGERYPAIPERTDVSASALEATRAQNRRVAVMVTQSCEIETSSIAPSK
jgi:outer membrane protein OmpA-like peptidoglycan-associated protein